MVSLPNAPALYQQTRLDVDPTEPNSVVDILVPSNASFFTSRNSPKRRRIERPTDISDENGFSRLCLASEADIYFRPHKEARRKPKSQAAHLKSVLWRILDERKCLELQSVDLCQDAKQKDALLTLRLGFENKIRAGGVALGEANERTAESGQHTQPLVLYVVTVAGELFTITLTRAMFIRKNETAEGNVKDWCQTHRPSAFTYRTPFRVLAKSDTEIWFGLGDGGLLKLDKPQSEPSSNWRETFFTEGVWKASLKGLIPWKGQRTMHYGGIDLELNSATSVAFSPDEKHIWTVCLDHTLKAWNIATGKITLKRDLTNDSTRDLQKPPEYVIDPVQSNLLRIYPEGNEGEYTVVTFSPKVREFKFWLVRDADSNENGVVEIRPEVHLIPPVEELMNTTVWTLENFFLQEPSHGSNRVLWLSVRSGASTHVLNVTFDLTGTTQDIKREWVNNWAMVNPGLSTIDALKSDVENPCDVDSHMTFADSESLTEKWLTFLFYPGRFTNSTLETALAVYQTGIGQRSRQSRKSPLTRKRPLAERICHSVGSSIPLQLMSDDSIAFERFSKDVASQWQIFYGVVKDLHQRREVSLSFTFDVSEGTPWRVMADCIAPSRMCSDSEILWHNRNIFARPRDFNPGTLLSKSLTGGAEPELGQVLCVVDVFRNFFSKTFLMSFKSTIRSVILQISHLSVNDPIAAVYEISEFDGQVSDDDYDKLTDAVNTMGGFNTMNNYTFEGILELLNEKHRGHHRKQQLTNYGARTLVRGAQETLQASQEIVLDLLLLIVFMASELDTADLAQEFDPRKVFLVLAEKAKEYDLLSWLASNTRQVTTVQESETSGIEALKSEAVEPAKHCITLLESMFIGDWTNLPFPNGSQPMLLTYWCRAWVFGPNLSQYYDGVTTYIMGNLLKNEDFDLAFQFLPYLPSMAWATYLRGRLYLARSEYSEAALYFEQAAPGLATGKFFDLDQYDRAGLLDLEERECFNDGFPRYYSHVASLYESQKAMSYVAEFSQLAIASTDAQEGNNPTSLKSELLVRLFNAALHTSQYQLAYEAITQYPNLDIVQPALRSLAAALISVGRVQLLLDMPFSDEIAEQMDDVLSAIVNKALHTTTSTAPGVLLRKSDLGPPVSDYWKVLYSWRIQHDNFRGAANVLWERLQVLRNARDNESRWEELRETYLMLINVLSLVDERWAWILVRPAVMEANESDGFGLSLGSNKDDLKTGKRKVVTLADVRKEWQEELDRRAEIEAGRFAFVGGFEGGGVNGDESVEVDVFA